ncbi:MAG: ATP phosphoribosyltransferase regulatory subunit [Actinomycetota bacterium]|nr:ATP phosphoribosyltransferase regulatory subunit [Actinomycetota bacterium]
MIHPVPPGTRDVLPDEMRELRALTLRLAGAFDRAGYGEVSTPSIEYEDVLRRGDATAAGAGFRLFDERGQILALRSDPTIPIARLVANRYDSVEGPLRFSYFENAYRAVVSGSGQPREFLQGGIELIGVPGVEGDAEVIALVVSALEEAGLRRHRVGLGDGMLYRELLRSHVPEDEHEALLELLWRRDLPGLEARVARLQIGEAAKEALVRVPALRGGIEILDRVEAPAVERLRELYELLRERGVAERVIFDLGMLRELGYYTGTIFEVYDPAVAFALGGGGRYDDLIGRFGSPRPACGAGLDVTRVHMAQIEEERL